ncbi:MAG TPA: serine/threonine-protein kinase, partial [Thermoanaerobaculia bacterium]|nr:serine/threonine-protein kinase [Thermoanaerobaculia bacterium]
GIVHRDISPENIMITREEPERVKVIDLGVAKVEDSVDAATRVGVFVGKLRYASPEHLGFLPEGEKIDGRADLFSLAMVLYEMLAGRPPFEATSPHEYVMLHSREQQFRPLDLPADLPGGAQLQAILAKALDRDRNKRFANAREFAAALEEVEKTLPDPNVMQTMHLQALDTDATWTPTPLPSVDTLHRQTVRDTKAAAPEVPPTIRTPLPPMGAAPTIQTPLPSSVPVPPPQPAPVVPRARHGSFAAFAIIALILLLAGGAIAALYLWRGRGKTDVAEVRPPAETQTATAAPPPSQANVDVITTTPTATTATTETVLTEIPTTTESPTLSTTNVPAVATMPPVERPRPVPQPRPVQEQPAPVPQPAPPPVPAPANVRTYIDGDSGDADVNEQLLANLRRQLSGVRSVAVRGSGEMYDDLVNRIQSDHGLEVVSSADTVITFNGTLDRLGRGRKRRSAEATITRNGRVIFRYELPAEEFRVGDSPAEAFSRVISEAFNN